jgi:N-acetylneuraminic acid mutarotase
MRNMLQKTIFITTIMILCTAFSLLSSTAQADFFEWTWMSGADTKNQSGTYGTLGSPDTANVPGARYGGISWTDSLGDLWLFGGNGRDSADRSVRLNDLWRYDPDTKEWAWISGDNETNQSGAYGTQYSPDTANIPGARYMSISWTDSSGDLWLFGGYGYDSADNRSYLNDLWRYDPDTNEWTWMSGDNEKLQ